MKNIYIVVIHYKGEKDTLECLDSLQSINHNGFNFHTILVDNNPEHRIKINEKKYKNINMKIIKSPTNVGFSGGNNMGIKYAMDRQADYVLLLNNDTLVKDNFLQQLFDKSEKNSEIGIIIPKIYFAKGYEFHKDRYVDKDLGKVFWYAGGEMDWKNVIGSHRGVDEIDKGQYDKFEETGYASGCCMLIRKSVIENIGLLDEEYFLYYEDSDFSERANRSGFKVFYHPESIIWHKNAGSAGGSGSNLQDYYITRNRLLFGNKYAPFRSRIALNREGLKLSLKGRKWQKRGAKDFYLRRFGKSTYNIN